MVNNKGLYFLGGCFHTRLEADERLGDFAALVVLDADDGRLHYRRVGEQEAFELGGWHLEALELDEFLDAIDDVDVAVGVEVG